MERMEKEFVDYKIALELKELGFDEPCWCYFIDDILNQSMFLKDYEYLDTMNQKYNTYVLAPTYSQAFRWFEDNHQLYPAVVIDQTSYPKYAFEIASFFGNPKDLTEKEWGWNEMVLSRSLYRTKTEAELECLKKLIEIVKEK